jgi:hypothetical protein
MEAVNSSYCAAADGGLMLNERLWLVLGMQLKEPGKSTKRLRQALRTDGTSRMTEHEDGGSTLVATYHTARRHDSGYTPCGLASGTTDAACCLSCQPHYYMEFIIIHLNIG